MAAHTQFPPSGAEPIVRGDPATFVVRFRIGGVDQDITTWTWRSMVRDRLDGQVVSQCDTFEVHTPNDMPDLFPAAPGTVPCVLLLRWGPDDTVLWSNGYVADIEQLTPTKRTWVIFDALRVDRDVSYATGAP
jgi:hypothetical protein